MSQITIDIPDEVLYDTGMSRQEANSFARKAVALCYYVQKSISLGYCAKIAGMGKESFIRFLSDNNISIFHYDDEEQFAEELNKA